VPSLFFELRDEVHRAAHKVSTVVVEVDVDFTGAPKPPSLGIQKEGRPPTM